MANLGREDIRFLGSLKLDGSPTGGWDIPMASRAQDAARSRAKRRGWAEFDRKTWAWRLLPAGREALRSSPEGEANG